MSSPESGSDEPAKLTRGEEAEIDSGDEVVLNCSRGVATITLNRPRAANAINAQMREQLPKAVSRAERDNDVRVILIRGAGKKGFSAGADITEFQPPVSGLAARAIKQSSTWLDALAEACKPTVAAIHGYCLGGGLEIALACDIRIAADSAVFGLPEASLAIIPGAGGTQRLPRVVGLSNALRLTLTGERIEAAAALRVGLVSEVVPADELSLRTAELAARIARYAPQAVAYAKEAIRSGSELPLADGLRLERDLSAVLMGTADRLEAAAAFRERREPNFRGA
jgi:enoyl-CoA hydratase/carnithine racemase